MHNHQDFELRRRQYSRLRVVFEYARRHSLIYESDITTYNEILEAIGNLGLDTADWIVPAGLLQGKPESVSYVGGGTRAEERRIPRSKFDQFAVPAWEAIGRELSRRQHASMSTEAPEPIDTPPSNSSEVWVVYGRDEQFRRTIFHLLRDVGLQPIEFNMAVTRSGSGSPNVLEVVLKEIRNAPAIVCLFTADDQVELRPELRQAPRNPGDQHEIEHLRDGGYQPRPNVLLETGMALAVMRNRTVIVTTERVREISDLSGLHEIRWRDTPEQRHNLVNRLEAIGCPVDRNGVDWMS